MKIGIKLGQLLEDRAMSQAKAAELLDMTPKHVSNIVTGKVAEGMPLGTLEHIAKCFGVEISYFFQDSISQSGNHSVNTAATNNSGDIEINYNPRGYNSEMQEVIELIEENCSKSDLKRLKDYLMKIKENRDITI